MEDLGADGSILLKHITEMGSKNVKQNRLTQNRVQWWYFLTKVIKQLFRNQTLIVQVSD